MSDILIARRSSDMFLEMVSKMKRDVFAKGPPSPIVSPELGRFMAQFSNSKNLPMNYVRTEFSDGKPARTNVKNEDFDIVLEDDLQKLPEKLLHGQESDFIVSKMECHAEKLNDIRLSLDAQRIRDEENAGGNSIESEALSLEFFRRSWNAKLSQTEMEIEYDPPDSKKTDYSVLIHGMILGISVTRAFAWKGKFTELEAKKLLKKKLIGIIESSRNVVRRSKWRKQILHILTPSMENAEILRRVYQKMNRKLKSNTVVVVTVTNGTIPFIFSQRWRECENLCNVQ